MRICIVAPEEIPVPPVRGGSVEICIHAIAGELAREHDVTVVSRSCPEYPDDEQAGRLRYVRVPGGNAAFYLQSALRRLRGQSFDWIQVENRPRFVPAVKKAFPRTPVSLYLHSLTFVSRPKITRAEAARCLRRADRIVVNSDSLRNRLRRRFPDIAGRLRTVNLAVDFARFRPPRGEEREAIRRQYGLADKFVVLYAGRLIPRKGIPVLIRAVRTARRRVPDIRLVVAGGGPRKGYRRKLERMAKTMGVTALFLGPVPHSRMHRIYWLADCFVCPSQKHEAFGLVNLEAMASEVPVIASDVGGVGEVVRHGYNGRLVKRYRDPRAFARQIVRVAGDRPGFRRLAREARADVMRRFGWRRTAEQLLRLYQSFAK